jgi:hypothetical protein
MPVCAARIRRFHRIGSPSLIEVEPGSDPGVSGQPRLLDVVIVDVDVTGGRRQPLVAQQFLDRFEVQSSRVEQRSAEVAQRVRPCWLIDVLVGGIVGVAAAGWCWLRA